MLFGAILAPNWTENFVSRFIVSRVTETERRVFENKKENILDFSHKKPSFFVSADVSFPQFFRRSFDNREACSHDSFGAPPNENCSSKKNGLNMI